MDRGKMSCNPVGNGKKRSSGSPSSDESLTKKACMFDPTSNSIDELQLGSVDVPSDDAAIPPASQRNTEVVAAPYVPPSIEKYEPPIFDLENLKNNSMHIKIYQARERIIQLLEKVKEMINNPSIDRFCPSAQKKQWTKEIDELVKQPEPEITIGVLGATGSGKTSLLKALIHEDKILPTSSSRGCTATVVELKFNREFLRIEGKEGKVVVYRGQVDFISLAEWKEELNVLINDCSDDENGVISKRRRDENEDIAASWSKIDAVYGSGTMLSYNGKPKKDAFMELSTNERVIKLLECTAPEQKRNIRDVTEGEINASEANEFLEILARPGDSQNKILIRKQRRWAESFRKKINSFVYRKGNGKEPQTWPLIRKVTLLGPWKCLSTGACLVDLPGVRDDNAARAKVAEKYVQNCAKLWIVAPIKRAVDDKTAKDLLGDEFKRRLLMDGNYGNVSFICTHSDDCVITEIIQDHEGIAKAKEGRWEQMLALREAIFARSKDDEELRDEIDSCKAQLVNQNPEGLSAAEKPKLKNSLELLRTCLGESADERSMKRRSDQQKLKGLASEVRNEFSKTSLQVDFKKGMEELLNNANKTVLGVSQDEGHQSTNVLPDDFELEVFCTASNEYLKLCGVTAGLDADAGCFTSVNETEIPEVFQSVLDTTEKIRINQAKTYIQKAGNILGRIQLYASGYKFDTKTTGLFSKAFELEMNHLVPELKQIAFSFRKKMEETISNELEPKLKLAAKKGVTDGFCVVNDWFESRPRSRQEPKNKGLYWTAFEATARRDGVFMSSSVGPINLNQELYNPLEHEYFVSWQHVMVDELNRHLSFAQSEMQRQCEMTLGSICNLFKKIGMDSLTTQRMQAAGKSGCESLIDGAFRKFRKFSTEESRRLNRSNILKLRAKLGPTYAAVSSVARGRGLASRQKMTMKEGAKATLTLKEFDPMMTELNDEAVELIRDVRRKMLDDTCEDIAKCLQQVCCLSWNDNSYMKDMENPKVFVEVIDSRNALLPNLVHLCTSHDNILDHLCIARESVHRVERNIPEGYKQAKANLMTGY